LADAGFATVEAYVEKEDKKGNGTGEYAKRESAPADRCLLTYLVARG
jgi:hypothetical protein